MRWGCEAGRCGGAAYCSPCRTSTTGRTRCRSRGRNPRCRQCRKSRSSSHGRLRGPRVGVRWRKRRTCGAGGGCDAQSLLQDQWPSSQLKSQPLSQCAVSAIDIRSCESPDQDPPSSEAPPTRQQSLLFAVLFRCPRRVELAARDGVEARAPDLVESGSGESPSPRREAAHVRMATRPTTDTPCEHAAAPSASRSGRSPPRAPQRSREDGGIAPFHPRAAQAVGRDFFASLRYIGCVVWNESGDGEGGYRGRAGSMA